MPDSHPEIDKDRAGKKFILTHFPAWDWYDTESMARTVADKAQEVIDAISKELADLKESIEDAAQEARFYDK